MYENLTYKFIVSKQIPFIIRRAVDVLQKQHKHWLLSLRITVSSILFSWQLTRVVLARRGENDAGNDTKQKNTLGGIER